MESVKLKYPSLNGLRALSIVLVIIHHSALMNNVFAGLNSLIWLKPILLFIEDGHLGVNVFFVISGFLITSLLLQEEIISKNVSLKNFYIRRVIRIFPAYYFLLFVYFILQLIGLIHINKTSWLTAITYTKYFNWNVDWLTSHAWSLSIEEHFYLIWPLIFVYSIKHRIKIAFSIFLIVPLIRAFIFFHPINWVNDLTLFTRADSIALGCIFALYKDEIIKIIQPHWRKVFYLSILSLFLLSYFKYNYARLGLSFIFIPLGTTYGSIANIAIAIIMMYSVFGPQKFWFKFLNLKIINSVGLLSYSIYLWQQIFIYGISNYWIGKSPQNLVFIIIAAMISYYFIEKPFLKMKNKFTSVNKKAKQKA